MQAARPMTNYFSGAVNIPEVDNNRPRHHPFKDRQIKSSELLPFSNDDERLSTFRAFIGSLAIDDVTKSFFACSIPAGSKARTVAPRS
jgi:hypothetical protein